MTISKMLSKGILEKKGSSKDEIENLLKIVERDFKDCKSKEVSYDWQFGIAYNAALKLANVLVRASHYRVKGGSHHMNTIAMIPLIFGEESRDDSEYLDSCRRKRNTVEYDFVGGASEADVLELQAFIVEFREAVLKWLEEQKIL